MPDFYFETFEKITPEFLLQNGIGCLLIDIDNTLAPYEEEIPNQRVYKWIESIKSYGITPVLISNNDEKRVSKFNEKLQLLSYPDASKPSTKCYNAALQELGADVKASAVIGDQLLTDALAGNLLGAKVIIVPPIKDKKSIFFRIKRMIEKPYIKKFKKCNLTNNLRGTQ